MALILYVVLVVVQLSSVLTTDQVPLKCFFQDYNFFSVFGKTSCDKVSNVNNTNYFGVVELGSSGFNKDGWNHETKNTKYDGLDNAILDDYGFNFNSKVLKLTFHTDFLVTYDYKSSGSVFLLPLNGQGSAEVALKNMQLGFTMPFEIKKSDNKKFVELKSFDYWYDIRDKAELKFTSHNKDKVIHDAIHQQLNQKWKFTTSHFGKPFHDALAVKVFNIFKDYFKASPLKDFDKC